MIENAKRRQKEWSRATSLKREKSVYDANLSSWLSEHEGECVLIKGKTVDGFCAIARRCAQSGVLAVRNRAHLCEARAALRAGPHNIMKRALDASHSRPDRNSFTASSQVEHT